METEKPVATPEITVLLVDDDRLALATMAHSLRSNGFRTVEAESGSVALDLWKAAAPSIAIVDYDMPGLSGLDVLRQLTQLKLRVPAIVITAHDEPETRSQCIAAGAQAYLCKPLDAKVLMDTIEQVVAQT